MPGAGWPFWAATSDERIDRAFDLARLEPGEHLIDLGCGDGRVLLRAAVLRGARVTGVELDPALAASARQLLAEHNAEGDVLEADFSSEDVPLDAADVVFAYLSPATLQRLKARLAGLRDGVRIVTTGFALPGWEPVEAGGRCFLYRLPAEATDVDRTQRGWDSAGALISVRPDEPALAAVKLHAAGGRVQIRVADGALAAVLAVRAGADTAEPGDEVVVDLRFEPLPAGSLLMGVIESAGDAPFQVLAVVDEGETGVWGLSGEGCLVIGEALGRGEVASVLAAARDSP